MDAMCIDFINSEFRDYRGRWVRDDLLEPGWMPQFLAKWDLQVDRPLDEAALAALVDLRRLLLSMTEALAKGPLPEQDLAALNATLLRVPLSRRMAQDAGEYRLEVVPLKRDWDWVQAEIAASFAHIVAGHDPKRLKICANSHCRWVFYDESKSRTRRYCTPEKCGNLQKMRRFRARHK